ncbi:hypothetical protein [Rhizobium leguminosarum]|uniref:hypothetical protein n=1 Tax=Rhizobium leguminosarum TaxID=384 RepID=UPI0003F65DD0|nr:hypothetical protein [Rhizobium leguminosarum]
MLRLFHRSEPEKAPDWYHTAAPDDRQEYDAFGPWVYEITKESEMPPRFRFAYAQHINARFLLKIPVHADRREMRPGMDLYAAVLAIDENGISIYRLVENRIVSGQCSWGGVAAISNGSNLLQGNLSLLLASGREIELAFNSVSQRLMEDAADFVRSRCASPARMQRLAATVPNIDITDHFFRAMLVMTQRRAPMPIAVVHFEPPGQRCLDRDGRRRITTGVLLLLTPSELIIVGRDRPARSLWHANYSALTTCVPLAHLKSYALREPTAGGRRPRFHELLLYFDGQEMFVSCLTVPETVLARLDDLGIAQWDEKAESSIEV